jgi:hypothetical protein
MLMAGSSLVTLLGMAQGSGLEELNFLIIYQLFIYGKLK